jgi:phytoene desaturase
MSCLVYVFKNLKIKHKLITFVIDFTINSKKMNRGKKVVIIGAGFSGLSSACELASLGFEVHVFEKNNGPGGRAEQHVKNGFTFDKGPSWYWLPDVFEEFFARYGRKTEDYYQLQRLNPSYRVFFGPDDVVDVPPSQKELFQLFEYIEPGSSDKLKKLLEELAYVYYYALFKKIRKLKPEVILTERVRIPNRKKYKLLFTTFVRHCFNIF